MSQEGEAQELLELPLLGYTVGITASRRRDELRTAFEKRGGRVWVASTLQIVPLDRDEELLGASQRCIDSSLDYVIATTGIGFRGWMEAADGWGIGETLRYSLSLAEIVSRGPKARGAIRASGLCETWTPQSESMSEVLRYLLARDLKAKRIAVQLHGEPSYEVVQALESAGAHVISVPVYRWVPPEDIEAVRRLIDATIRRQLDAITFTSAPAVAGLLEVAKIQGLEDQLLEALGTDVTPICVGPVCSAPLERRGIDVVIPPRSRLGALIRTVAEEVPKRSSRQLIAAGKHIEVRGHVVMVDGELVPLPPVPMALLRALASAPGKVFSRSELRSWLPGEDAGLHAVEMAITRLRALLEDPSIIQTVVKRGYRLMCDEHLPASRPFNSAGSGASNPGLAQGTSYRVKVENAAKHPVRSYADTMHW